MPRPRLPRLRPRPRVALCVETSLASGRDMLLGIARYASAFGPWSIYHEPSSLSEAVPRGFARWRGDGIIARVTDAATADMLTRTGIPVVDILGESRSDRLPLVHVDNAAISELAAKHLLERGFRSFAFCGMEGFRWSRERQVAFDGYLAAKGYRVDAYLISEATRKRADWDEQLDRMGDWIARLPKPVGVMISNDPLGRRFLEACQRANVAVPDEAAVVGVDNDEPVCAVSDPPLSSVIAGHEQVGYEAARLLDRLMAGGTARTPIYVAPEGLVTRMSTDALAIGDPDVARAMRFIREHACDGIGVDDVARHACLSRSTLKRRFASAANRTVRDAIQEARLKRATELLTNTNLPIGQVAQQAGFLHQEYFGAVFKAETGLTPFAFRRTHGSAERARTTL